MSTGREAYRQAGVDVAAGESLVDRIRPLAAATRRAGSVGSLGGFAAAFDPAAAGYRDPLLVAATDGVGTKLRLALDCGSLETIGIDLVAMCANDLVCHGAEPLFFLDYYATGRLEPAVAATVIAGIAEGCRAAGMALVGGETAEMPGMYAAGDLDLAGFAVGAVERDALLPRPVAAGDAAIALAAAGPHANGFSLIRQIVERSGLDWRAPAPYRPEMSLGRSLLTPTALYVRPALALAGRVQALAHVTGGGVTGNLGRILPPELALELEPWPLPAPFGWLMRAGGLDLAAMLAVFNCGVGMVAICPPAELAPALAACEAEGVRAWRIGTVRERRGAAVRLLATPAASDG